MRILAIETSCDDTAAAVLVGREVRSNIVSSQDEVHRDFGGIVPELASRSHMRDIHPVIDRALTTAGIGIDDIEGVAATRGPGLIGSLLVGLCTAKAIAFARELPFVAVNHLEGHLLSAHIERDVEFPFLGLLVSGGHTSLHLALEPGRYRLLGTTRDDAAGEAFDKVAKILGLGYPGGRVIDELARQGDPAAIRFPRARLKPSHHGRVHDFSFSGLKTAVWTHVRDRGRQLEPLSDLAASFQEAVVDMLLDRLHAAAAETSARRVVVAGGVAANSRLRERALSWGREEGVDVIIPPLRYCTDNAAMIGFAARRE